LSKVLDDDCAAYLQEILKMGTSIFMCLSAEWGSLHHVDVAWLELKLKVIGSKCWSSVNVLDAWSRELTQSLVSHSLKDVIFEKDKLCSACQAGKQVGNTHPKKSMMSTS
jgi:hypothetical protein